MSGILLRNVYIRRAVVSKLTRRWNNSLGIGASDNDAAFPKPEVVPGIGDGVKDYGFPVNKHMGPDWWEPEDRKIYYRRKRPYWSAWPIGTVLYFYLLWNWYANFEEIIGETEFHPPNPDLFTDEELGIPADDVPGYGLLSELE